jgi:hypothetical protein
LDRELTDLNKLTSTFELSNELSLLIASSTMNIDTVTSQGSETSEAHASASRAAIFPPAIGAIGVFFGGPLAAVALAALNARRLQRLESDRFWLRLAALGAGSAILGAAWLAVHFRERGPAFRDRFYFGVLAVGLGLWGAFCTRQRTWGRRDSGAKGIVWSLQLLLVVVLSAMLQLGLNAIATLFLAR